MHTRTAIHVAFFSLGFLSISTQIYLIREFLNVSQGNEMIMGIVLSMWMLLTGFGAYSVKFLNQKWFSFRISLLFLIALSALPSIMLIALDLIKAGFFPYGKVINLWEMIILSVIILFPFCYINGFLFSVLSKQITKTHLVTGFSIESAGSMVAGVLVNFIFLWISDTWLSITILTTLAFILILIYTFLLNNRLHLILVIVFSIVFVGLISFFDYQMFSGSTRYPNQHILVNRGTPYGQVVITAQQAQLNLYENGVLLCSSNNEILNEEKVHFAMIQHPDPRNILQISGGFSGSIAEILKYRPENVDYVELNSALIRIASLFSNVFQDDRVHIYNADARRFIRETKRKYDVVLIDLPAPSTLQLNRFYTDEFFSALKMKLYPGAVVSLSLPTGSIYISPQAVKLNSSLYHTLKNNFKQVMIVPADRNYFLGSDSLLRINIPHLILEKEISTVFVNPFYLDENDLSDRSDFMHSKISSTVSINHDFHPVTMVYQQLWSFRIISENKGIMIILSLFIILVMLISLNPVSAGLFAGGFTLASIEVILIFSFQVLFGYIFQVIGVIIMLFMLGLAAGSRISVSFFRNHLLRSYLILQIITSIIALMVPVLLVWFQISMISDLFVQLTVALTAFIISFIVGMEYGLAAGLTRSSTEITVASNYSADLFGAAAGAFLVTALLYPLLGMVQTGLVLFLLNVLCAMNLFFRRRKYSMS